MARHLASRAVRSSLGLLPLGLVAAAALAACHSTPAYDVDPTAQIKQAAKAPPPISGGTLALSKDGLTAFVADSDRDHLFAVDAKTLAIKADVALEDGDEPGRVVADDDGNARVALRRGGAVVTWNPTTNSVRRDPVCAAPRGLAYDSAKKVIHVACATGELVTLPAAGGAPIRVLKNLGLDLRDVLLKGDHLIVSRFRAPELIEIDANGVVVPRAAPLTPLSFDTTQNTFSPSVAWRTIASNDGTLYMIHQRSMTTTVTVSVPEVDGYGQSDPSDPCATSIVQSAISIFGSNGESPASAIPPIPNATLPVDIAVPPGNGPSSLFAIAAAGSKQVMLSSTSDLQNAAIDGDCENGVASVNLPGEPVALAFTSGSTILVQMRDSAQLAILEADASLKILATADLPVLDANGADIDVGDTGHDLFHLAASPTSAIACASCHPEGREDGHIWKFDDTGARRTQNIGNGVLETAPLHWDGDMKSLDMIMAEVFVHRMGGKQQGPLHVDAIARFVDSLPVLPGATDNDADAVKHGEELFNSPAVGCATCHNGPKLTNNQTVDVGTGRAFQVPSLIAVSHRAPYMHDGCAATLKDRFGPCGTGIDAQGNEHHGHTSQLSDADIDDLVAYLETL